MPELPEVEIMVRRLGAALAGAVVESALAKGVGTLKSFDPPLGDLKGHAFTGMRRRSKLLIAGFDGDLLLILHPAKLSPFKRGNTLDAAEADVLRSSMVDRLGAAIDHYEAVVGPTIPDKLPMPLTVHGRQGSPCPRCGTALEAVFFEDYVVAYCPQCQTGGRLLKDRRLSRLLK